MRAGHPEPRAGVATVRGWNGVEQRICSIPHRLIRACFTGPETKKNPHARQRLSTCRGTQDHCGGAVYYAPPPTPDPSTTSRTGKGGSHKTSGRWDNMAPAASQSYGRTAGDNRRSLGEDGKTTNGRRGRKRRSDKYTRGKIGCRKGALGESRRGREGGTTTISEWGSITHKPN